MPRVAISLLVLGLALPAHADQPRGTPFDRGRVGLSIGLGSQTALGHRYFVAGAGVGYYVLDGLELELGGSLYFGDGPSISTLSPGVRYVAQPLVGKWPIVPYVGAFYNRWFVGDDIDDVAAIGTRSGVIYLSGRLLLGIGIGYAHFVSKCTQNCDQLFPDLSIGMTF